MERKKKIRNITFKDIEAILQSEKSLSVDQDERIEHYNRVTSIITLSEILSSMPKLLWLNETNDLVKKWTGKDRDNLENLRVEDIELIIKEAIKSKQYGIVVDFARVYFKIVKYFLS